MKRLKSLVKSQQKLRGKRKQVVKELARDHPENGYKLKKLEVKKTPGQPNFESQVEGLHEAIFSIVVPESTADERRRTEIFTYFSYQCVFFSAYFSYLKMIKLVYLWAYQFPRSKLVSQCTWNIK